MKKLSLSILTMLLVGVLFSNAILAKDENAKQALIALGDSIAYGYNLGVNNHHPSKEAFPHLIAEELDTRVRNLGEPGWTTEQLLDAVKNNEKFRQSIKHTDYIVMDIGSNDLIKVLKVFVSENEDEFRLALYYYQHGNPAPFEALINELLVNIPLPQLLGNLNEIISEIQGLTDAKIVLYNVYNPFQVKDPLHHLGDIVLGYVNPHLVGVAVQNEIAIADAFSAFGDNQAEYVIANDIHPTVEGQKVLAEIGLQVIKEQ